MARIDRGRDRDDFYAVGWPEAEGPTFSISKRKPQRFSRLPARRAIPLKRRPGRPKRPLREAIALFILFERAKTYIAQGSSREGAVMAAMLDFKWPDDRPQEVKRLLLTWRRGV
jgi:hypothetical protein